MIALLEAPPPQGPRDLRRAVARSLDAWRVGGEGVALVEPDDPGAALAEARLVLREPEAAVAPRVLARAAAALAGRPRARSVVPAGFFSGGVLAPEPYATVWEFEEIAAEARTAGTAGMPVPEDAAPPAELVRTGRGDGPRLFAPEWVVHSFGRRKAHLREEVLALVPVAARRVLEIGCGEGLLGEALEKRGARVTGVEADTEAASSAARRLSEVFAVPVERALDELSGSFDAVIAADILEHLEDPVAVLRSLNALCAPGGALVVSLPNAAHAAVLAGALNGRWDPALEGIVADDHRTYSGRAGWTRLLRVGGWSVEAWTPVPLPTPRSRPWLEVLEGGALHREDLTAAQWLGIARPAARQGAIALGEDPWAAESGIDPDDPVEAVRRSIAGALNFECLLPNATWGEALEPLLRGDVAEGAARFALARAATSHGLLGRFAGSGLGLELEPRGEAPLPPAVSVAVARARAAGLPVAPEALAPRAFRATFLRKAS